MKRPSLLILFDSLDVYIREMRKVKGRRIPFSSYMPESMLTEAMKRLDRK